MPSDHHVAFALEKVEWSTHQPLHDVGTLSEPLSYSNTMSKLQHPHEGRERTA
jgi:hypothetical protein